MGCENSAPIARPMTMAGRKGSKPTEKPYVDMQLPAPLDNEYAEIAWAIPKCGEKFKPVNIPRAKVTAGQVRIEVLYTGVSTNDVSIGQNKRGGTVFPFVPGQEVVGVVKELGANVTKFKMGDHVGVGGIVDSCLNCQQCKSGDEQLCSGEFVGTINSQKRFERVGGNKDLMTMGGYSGSMVVHERFCLKVPKTMKLSKAAPLMYSGVAVYEPLKEHGFVSKPKQTVGVVGIGSLGSLAIKIAKALGHTVIAISSNSKKNALARKRGADHFAPSTEPAQMAIFQNKCDIILDTISQDHDINTYLPLLGMGGNYVILGTEAGEQSIKQVDIMSRRQSVNGSMIGGMQNAQEFIDFCAAKDIYPDVIEVNAIQLDRTWSEIAFGNADGINYVLNVRASALDSNFLPGYHNRKNQQPGASKGDGSQVNSSVRQDTIQSNIKK